MDIGGHILSRFNDDLNLIIEQTVILGSTALSNLDTSLNGLLNRDIDLCIASVEAQKNGENLHEEIEKLGMSIIIRYRPLATDLRVVISSMKIASNLERICDHTLSIAKRSKKMLKHEEPEAFDNMQALYHDARELLESALRAYADANTSTAEEVLTKANDSAKLFKKTSKLYTKLLEKSDGQERDYLNLVFIARYLDHIGDMAANIAKDVLFTYSMDQRNTETE